MTKLAIFDLDGTLLNTVEDLGNATNYALEQCGFPIHPIDECSYCPARVMPEPQRMPP